MRCESLVVSSNLITLVVGATASAGERIEETAREAFATDTWEVLELGENHTVALWRGRGIA